MPKYKRHKPHSALRSSAARAPDSALAHVDELIEDHKPAKAFEELQELVRRYPRDPEVLARLYNTASDVNDSHALLTAAVRLAELMPNDPDIAFGLAGAYLSNVFPALAVAALRKGVARWPNHPMAAHARGTIAEVESEMTKEWARAGLPADHAADLAALHEQVQVELHEGRYAEARRLAERVLSKAPRFTAPLNNISLAHFAEGRLNEAIVTARRVLEIDPDNFHALANLAHYLCLLGRLDEARSVAERLKAAQSERVDVWLKKAEALSRLGDDAGVLQAFEQAEQAGMLAEPFADPYLIHLAAAAAARLGDEVRARSLWERALKVSSGFAPARENLRDLKRSVGKRNGPWAIPLNGWLPSAFVQDLARQIEEPVRQGKEKAVEQGARRFLQDHPEMNTLVPILLARGDPEGRDFALRLARIAETPEMHAALLEFALGQAGPDEKRREAAYALAGAGVLPRGKPVRMWTSGQWTELFLSSYEITAEPKRQLPDPAQQWLEKAVNALRQGKPDKAEPLLRKALAQAPDDPSLLQNLAAVYAMRGDNKQAEALTRQAVERDPDYIIGRCNMAQFATLHKNYDEADQWLEPVMEQTQLHLSELDAMCQARVQLELARGRRDAAKSWLDMWTSIHPDAPNIEHWRDQVEPRHWATRLRGLWRLNT